MDLKKIKEISIVNTIRMNLFYFGIKSLIHPIILASKNVKINKLSGSVKVNTLHRGGIQIGFGHVGVIDTKYTRTLWENTGHIEFGGNVHFGPGTRIICNGHLKFNGDAMIIGNSTVICNNEISIGDDFDMSWDCLIMDTDFHTIINSQTGQRLNTDGSIMVGNHVWIGCRSTVLKNTTIPSNCVIASNSLISKHLLDENTLYTTNRIIRKGIDWIH